MPAISLSRDESHTRPSIATDGRGGKETCREIISLSSMGQHRDGSDKPIVPPAVYGDAGYSLGCRFTSSQFKPSHCKALKYLKDDQDHVTCLPGPDAEG